MVVNHVSSGSTTNPHLKSLLEEILLLLNLGDWQTQLHHVFREINKCVDFLARSAFDAPMKIEFISQVNLLLGVFVTNDCNGSYAHRFV